MATASAHAKRSWSATALDDSHRPAPPMRPSTVPAYYQGRPASMWLALFRRGRAHA